MYESGLDKKPTSNPTQNLVVARSLLQASLQEQDYLASVSLIKTVLSLCKTAREYQQNKSDLLPKPLACSMILDLVTKTSQHLNSLELAPETVGNIVSQACNKMQKLLSSDDENTTT